MANPLFEYSAIVDRPYRPLPNNAKVAVWVGVNVEHHVLGKPALSISGMPFSPPDSLNYGWRDYGSRVGIFRMLDRMNAIGVRGTAIINSDVIEQYPTIVGRLREANWGWVSHGRNNSTLQSGMSSVEEERAYIAEVTETLTRGLGQRPRGWLSPARDSTMATNDLLAELGYDYVLDWSNDDQVYPYTVASGRLACIPYSVEINDILAYVVHHHTAAQFDQTIADHFDELYAEGDKWPAVLGLSIHPYLSGQPSRIGALIGALERMARHEDVWMTTSDEIADWYYGDS